MTHEEFDCYYMKWRERIAALARRLSGGDHDLADDLKQVGLCALWKLDLEHVTEDGNRYLWRSLRHQMIDALRKERRAHRVMLWRANQGKRATPPRGRMVLHLRGTPQHYGAAPYAEEERESIVGTARLVQ